MKRIRGWKGLAVGVALTAFCGVGVLAQQPKDRPDGPAERTGEKLDEAARSLRKGLRQAGEAVRASFAEIREDVHGMGVEARIYGRLHWDKTLTDISRFTSRVHFSQLHLVHVTHQIIWG